MTAAFGLVAKVLRGQAPPRALVWGLLNKANYLLRTGNRRFEFERLYLDDPDPWNYHTSPYEQAKYERLLAHILALRISAGSALEIGCSIGVFSKMLAREFERVTCVDVSSEALRLAAEHNRSYRNIEFIRTSAVGIDLGSKHDVIVCAEILYYIQERWAPQVLKNLDAHLAPGGVIIMVGGTPTGSRDPLYFDGWEAVLATRFERVFKDVVPDPLRPYEIVAFRRREQDDRLA